MSALSVTELVIENTRNPLGIDSLRPKFRWVLAAGIRQQRQSAYQICVSSAQEVLLAGQADIWDSGMVRSECSIGVSYEGRPLKPRTRYYWKVRVWDMTGQPSQWSPVGWFETGLLKPEDWSAQWITHNELSGDATVQLRADFTVSSRPARGRTTPLRWVGTTRAQWRSSRRRTACAGLDGLS